MHTPPTAARVGQAHQEINNRLKPHRRQGAKPTTKAHPQASQSNPRPAIVPNHPSTLLPSRAAKKGTTKYYIRMIIILPFGIIQNKVPPGFWNKQGSFCHLERTYKDLQFLEMHEPDGNVLATHGLKERQGGQVQRLYFSSSYLADNYLLWRGVTANVTPRDISTDLKLSDNSQGVDEEMDWELVTEDPERPRSPKHEVIELLSPDPSNGETSNVEDKVVKKLKGKGEIVELPQRKCKILNGFTNPSHLGPAPGMITMPLTPVWFGGHSLLLEA
ncbi:hypothetical protein P691DRAFT_783437 [Macrolepiota fuliginosa MF-IS2]|uniref:Uncharacterized protein n=1 Tax=Macrolepiota fuliginosa MF-IS2 TaxID=1400762 RepID=A0A9P5WY86_9AGAR|nr:hypothetical protein P691DRAFT_783437 [Macrolepiota fuliginosa MF-IS2]